MKNILYIFLIFFTVIIPGISDDIKAQVCPIPEVFLGNDTLICPGDAFYLDAGTHDLIEWNDGSDGQYLLVTEPGIYTVTVVNACGNSAYDEIIVDPAEAPELLFNLPVREYFCKGELVNVTAEDVNSDGTVLYEWSDSNTREATIEIDTSGTYTVTATNEFGCKSSKEIYLEFQYPTEKEKILLTTYDIQDGKNIVVWSKTPDKRTRRFALYGGNTDDDFINYADFTQSNIFVDPLSNPLEKPHIYNLRVQDSCDNFSRFSLDKAHRTMHLRTSITEKENILLEWERYVGFKYDQFYIYRGTGPDKFQVIDSMKHDPLQVRMQYNDLTAEKGIRYYYIIKVNTPDTVYVEDDGGRKAGNGPFVHSLSNLDDNIIKGTGMAELEYLNQFLNVYPNPVKDQSIINYKVDSESHIKFSIYNITGHEIATIFDQDQQAGEYEIVLNPSKYHLPPGVFILKMKIGGHGILTRKLIRQ